jgi:hypothetical protein
MLESTRMHTLQGCLSDLLPGISPWPKSLFLMLHLMTSAGSWEGHHGPVWHEVAHDKISRLQVHNLRIWPGARSAIITKRHAMRWLSLCKYGQFPVASV